MDGFKQLPKMQCFKEGGAVNNIMKKGGKVKHDVPAVKEKDTGPKSKMAMPFKGTAPDVEDEVTTKMKKGGRTKKATGTVRKYKDGGAVGVYGAKKSSGDKDSIKKAKDIKPAKAAAESKASARPALRGSDVEKEKSKPAGDAVGMAKSKESDKAAAAKSGAKKEPNKYKKGGNVKKMAAGSLSAPMAAGAPAQPMLTGPNSMDEAHKLALMEQMRKLPPAMQLQLLQQQQNIGGNNPLNSIANQANPQVGPQPTNMGTMGQ
jgi:hypothetical protein